MPSLPPLAPFPSRRWWQHLSGQDWRDLSDAWIALSEAYLQLSDDDFRAAAEDHHSVALFLSTLQSETASSPPPVLPRARLLKATCRLTQRLLALAPSPQLLEFSFLSDFAWLYPRSDTAPLLASLFSLHGPALDASLSAVKKLLISHLDSGPNRDLGLIQSHLAALNPLLHASPQVCVFFLAGSDFFDGLVSCFRLTNPPLRRAIITTLYLAFVGLTDADPPMWAMLSDQLFALRTAAESHKKGPLGVNDSLVAELVTATPLLAVLLRRAERSDGAAESVVKKSLYSLESYKKETVVPPLRPPAAARRQAVDGKAKESATQAHAEVHAHLLSRITQIQDLFPNLGAGFVAKCLDHYQDDVEQVVAGLLGHSLPSYLSSADRTEALSVQPLDRPSSSSKPPGVASPTPASPPARRNVYDDDEFDRLAADASKISFGKKTATLSDKDAQHQITAPNKAAILSALAAFDSDDDERDDTYDAADVGGTVDSLDQEADATTEDNEEALFRAYQGDASVFGRDAATRRSTARSRLRDETGMTDEAIEGWAIMLTRNPQRLKRLQAKFAFAGQQQQLERTAWRRVEAGAEAAENEPPPGGDVAGRGSRGGAGRARGRGGGGTRDAQAARRNKEAHKGSRANHNRRDGRAKKMASGAFGGSGA